MHTIHIHRTAYQVPSRWDELTRDQVIRAAWLSTQLMDRMKLAKLLFLVLTLSLPWWKRMKLQYFYLFRANTDERGDLVYLTRSFAEFTQFTAQNIQKIGGKSVLNPTYYGPASKLTNCTLWEYIKAEQYFTQYLNTREEEWLNKMIAVIYRPKRPRFDPQLHEDIRIPLIDTGIPYRAKEIAKMPLALRIAILMWFDGCRTFLIKAFPLIFKKKEEEPDSIQAKLGGKEKSGSWLDLITGLSANMTQFTEIGNTNLTIALTDISHRIKTQNEKAKSQRPINHKS